MRVSWTPTARLTYLKILDYIQKEWTKREVQNFINEVQKVLSQLEQNPDMFQSSKKIKNVRKGFISRHITLFYRIKLEKKELEHITFWDNRQDPGKLSDWED